VKDKSWGSQVNVEEIRLLTGIILVEVVSQKEKETELVVVVADAEDVPSSILRVLAVLWWLVAVGVLAKSGQSSIPITTK
jgi:hypothetical protein